MKPIYAIYDPSNNSIINGFYDNEQFKSIDKINKTITRKEGDVYPFIIISEGDHKNICSQNKPFCVVGEVYQEYIKPLDIQLQEARTAKLAEITPARNAFMYADIEYNGSFFINSLTSGSNITAALAIMGTSINWLDSSGNEVVMTKAQLKELGGLILGKRSVGYLQEAVLIGQINACQSLEELQNININFN